MRNERGFTLVEIIASLVIVTIVLISIVQLLIQTNKTAETNNEKLVLIHLADMELERLKIDSTPVKTALNDPDLNITWTNDTDYPIKLNGTDLEKPVNLNDKTYTIRAWLIKESSREPLALYNVRVEVSSPVSKSKGTIEGLVEVK